MDTPALSLGEPPTPQSLKQANQTHNLPKNYLVQHDPCCPKPPGIPAKETLNTKIQVNLCCLDNWIFFVLNNCWVTISLFFFAFCSIATEKEWWKRQKNNPKHLSCIAFALTDGVYWLMWRVKDQFDQNSENNIKTDPNPDTRLPSYMLPRHLLILFLICNHYFFYILSHPCYITLLISPSTDKTSVIYLLQPLKETHQIFSFGKLSQDSLHIKM